MKSDPETKLSEQGVGYQPPGHAVAPTAPTPERLKYWIHRWGWILILGATWGLLLVQLDFGWIPNDDGTLAHAADRVRQGEIPHLDFDEPYPGLSSFLNAVALSRFGDNLLSLRYPFIVLVGGWMVLSYRLAQRVLPPLWGALTVALMAACVFLHMSPMPTWYILILGTGAIYCTVKYEETQRIRSLFLAGLLMGIGTLMKTTAFLGVLPVGMFLAIRRIRTSRPGDVLWGRGVLILGVIAITAFLALDLTIERALLFLGPLGVVVAAEWRPPVRPIEIRHRRHLMTEVAVVTAGLIVSIGAFIVAYWRFGGLDELARSVLSTPGIYMDQFNQNIPSIRYALITVATALICWPLLRVEIRVRQFAGTLLIVLAAVVYVSNPTIAILAAYTPLIWLSLLVGVAYLVRPREKPIPLSTVGVVLAAICFQLMRFPTSNLYYLVHGLPLLILGLSMIIAVRAPRATPVSVFGLAIILGILVVAKADGRMFAGQVPFESDPYVALEMRRGELRVPVSTAYINDVVQLIAHHETSHVLLAGPDSPEVYYLSGVDNATPVFFDFLSQEREGASSTDDYLHQLLPDIFVNNREPARSTPVPDTRIPASCVLTGTFGPRDVYLDCG